MASRFIDELSLVIRQDIVFLTTVVTGLAFTAERIIALPGLNGVWYGKRNWRDLRLGGTALRMATPLLVVLWTADRQVPTPAQAQPRRVLAVLTLDAV
jgi:hypothetical protein